MDICTFHEHYLNSLLEKLTKEANKRVVFLGEFNIDLLCFDKSANSKTLIDNMFCNISNPLVKTAISGDILSKISDHLPHFFALPDFFSILYQLNITLYPMTGKNLAKITS